MDFAFLVWVSVFLIVILGITIYYLIKIILGRNYEKENREETERKQKKRAEEKCW